MAPRRKTLRRKKRRGPRRTRGGSFIYDYLLRESKEDKNTREIFTKLEIEFNRSKDKDTKVVEFNSKYTITNKITKDIHTFAISGTADMMGNYYDVHLGILISHKKVLIDEDKIVMQYIITENQQQNDQPYILK